MQKDLDIFISNCSVSPCLRGSISLEKEKRKLDNIMETRRHGEGISPRKKVLEILEATTGGTRRHLQYLLRNIDLERFEVTFAYSDRRDAFFSKDLETYAARGIHLVEIPMRREIRPVEDFIALVRLMKLIRQQQYDVIHAHSSKAGFLGRLAARLTGVGPVVYTPHAFAFQYQPKGVKGKLYRGLERLAGRWTDLLLCVSDGERHVAQEHTLTRAPIEVLANVVKANDKDPIEVRRRVRKCYNIPENSPVVGMVAQFRPQKGYRHFIEAIPQVLSRCQEAIFLVVGDGPERLSVEESIRNLKIESHVILAGHQEDPADYYPAMDVFVLSSLWEGMPYVILEAMAASLPIVATEIAGNADLVRHGVNGLLVPPADSHPIARTISRLLNDKTLREKYGQESRRLIQTMPTIDQWIRRYESIYLRAVSLAKSTKPQYQVAPDYAEPHSLARTNALERYDVSRQFFSSQKNRH